MQSAVMASFFDNNYLPVSLPSTQSTSHETVSIVDFEIADPLHLVLLENEALAKQFSFFPLGWKL